MKAAAYARISTSKQDLDVKLDEIRQFAGRKGWTLVATYSDVASGAREDRTDFRRLLAAAAKGQFGVVIVQRFDRPPAPSSSSSRPSTTCAAAGSPSSRSRKRKTSTPPRRRES